MSKLEYIFVLSLIAMPIIVIKLAVSLYEWYSDRTLLRTGAETTGTIVDEARHEACENDSSDTYSRFFAEYTVGGRAYRVLSRFHGRKHAFLGKEYAIVYDPDRPERGRFKCDDTLIWPVRAAVIALAVALGVFAYGYAALDF